MSTYSNSQITTNYIEISCSTNNSENSFISDNEISYVDQIHQIFNFNTNIYSQIQYLKFENDFLISKFSHIIWQPPQN